MKRKNLKKITVIAMLLSFFFTGGIFAYWASSVTGDSSAETPQITIGVGQEATTMISLSEEMRTQGVLVPAGYEGSGKVSSITITYEVTLQATDAGAEGAVATLSCVCQTLANSLLHVEITLESEEIIAGGEVVLVNVCITLTEPANYDEYVSVAGLDFDIPLTFSAVI